MIGESFGSYRVVRRLGQGGMGVVYVAEHPLLGKKAVVKQLLPELSQNQEIVQRFFNEARAATMIRHPGIVDVFDFGYHASGSAFIVMEFLEGESLAARLTRERALHHDDAAPIIAQIASAVGAAHEVGIVHRDLKPDNVFLSPEPGAPRGIRVKVLDFGIAKLAGDASHAGLKTRTGAVMGTPTYMSPEQCHGAAELDHRADIYSLGCIVFEIFSGRTPFVGEGLGEILGAHMFQPPPPLRSLVPSVTPEVDALVFAMLAKSPADRPQSMAAVVAAIDGSAPIAAAPPPAMTSMPRAPVTTLGGAAGEAAKPTAVVGKRSSRALVIAVPAVAIVGALAVWLATRGGSEEKHAAVAAVDASAAPPKPTGTLAGYHQDCVDGSMVACGHEARLLIEGADGVSPDPTRAMSIAGKACDGGVAIACTALALAYRDGAGVTADATAAADAAHKACAGDDADGLGCAIAASFEAGDKASDYAARAVKRLGDECTASQMDSCVALADVELHGHGVARDLAKANELLQASCDGNVPEGCLGLARVYELGQGVRPDRVRARELERRAVPGLTSACNAGRLAACGALGRELVIDTGSSRDPVRAAAALAKACDGNDGEACLLLAGQYASGDGVARDGSRAGETYRRAGNALEQHCEAGDARSCERAAQLLVDGRGVHKDLQRAVELASHGCDLGSSDACIGWGANAAADAPRAFDAALALARPACDAGDLAACDVVGDVQCLGPDGVKDAAAGVAVYQKACDGGLGEACFDLAWARSNGVGGAKDTDAAHDLYDRACKAGHGPACNNLAYMKIAAKDADGAIALFDQGCDDGDAASCVNLASALSDGKLTARDPTRVAELKARACVLGAAAACN